MKNRVQIKIENKKLKEAHESRLRSVLSRVEEIVPDSSKIQGYITGTEGQYEGRIHIKTKIGAFVAKARARNLFSLISTLQVKLMRQVVNWREKRASKKRYHRRKKALALVDDHT